jgi:hypothetical protein
MTIARLAAASAATALALTTITGCQGGNATAGSSGTPPGTDTVTVTQTSPPTSATPSTPSRTTTLGGLSEVPTTSRDLSLPSSPQAYTAAFVAAWVRRDRIRANELATPSAVTAAFAHRAGSAPQFQRCDGAMGSSYCTWHGTGYTLIVRVLNYEVQAHHRHAIIEARYGS